MAVVRVAEVQEGLFTGRGGWAVRDGEHTALGNGFPPSEMGKKFLSSCCCIPSTAWGNVVSLPVLALQVCLLQLALCGLY